MKYYVKSGELTYITQADSPQKAITKALQYDWGDRKMKLEFLIFASEQGFRDINNASKKDFCTPTSLALKKAGWANQ